MRNISSLLLQFIPVFPRIIVTSSCPTPPVLPGPCEQIIPGSRFQRGGGNVAPANTGPRADNTRAAQHDTEAGLGKQSAKVVHRHKGSRCAAVSIVRLTLFPPKTKVHSRLFYLCRRIDSHLNGSGGASEGSPERDQEARQAAAAAAAAYAKRPVSMYETRQTPRDESRPPITQSLYSMAPAGGSASMDPGNGTNVNGGTGAGQLPSFEEVKRRTDVVARRIKDLFAAMKDLSQREAFVPSAERIRLAVVDLMALFPASIIASESLRGALQQLNFHGNLIQAECARLQQCLAAEGMVATAAGTVPNGGGGGGGSAGVAGAAKPLAESIQQSMEQVRGCAYDLAMSTKMLITHLQQA